MIKALIVLVLLHLILFAFEPRWFTSHRFFKRQGLIYKLQIMSRIAPGKERKIRASMKAMGLNPIFEYDHKSGGKMLLGAFQKPEEARAAAEILSREKIAFRLVAR